MTKYIYTKTEFKTNLASMIDAVTGLYECKRGDIVDEFERCIIEQYFSNLHEYIDVDLELGQQDSESCKVHIQIPKKIFGVDVRTDTDIKFCG